MNSKEIIFTLNQQEKIVINLLDSLDMPRCCYNSEIFFLTTKEKIMLAPADSLKYYLDIFAGLLVKIIDKDLVLDPSINKDIGYLENEKEHNINIIFDKLADDSHFWTGSKYSLWGAIYDENSFANSWLYNDVQGSMIFEITPFYRWHFIDSEDATEIEDYIPYEGWIKNYKPILTRKIPQEVAREWLATVTKILQKIEENVKKEFNAEN